MTVEAPLVAVVGASGFIGTAVCAALERRGASVARVSAPRVRFESPLPISAEVVEEFPAEVSRLAKEVAGADAAVNCAGQPDASLQDDAELLGANGVVPALVAEAAHRSGVRRLVHVSSAVVQGRLKQLDESDTFDGFSAYSRSKIEGERMVAELGPRQTVSYRPPSVHASSRRVTRMTARIARSGLASVAAPGSQNSPQALVDNVGDLVAFLALVDQVPPRVVAHPSEGISSAELLELLGGRNPRIIPRPAACAIVHLLASVGRKIPAAAANARRVEMLWFGQAQARSWANQAGWEPVSGKDEWRAMGRRLVNEGDVK